MTAPPHAPSCEHHAHAIAVHGDVIMPLDTIGRWKPIGSVNGMAQLVLDRNDGNVARAVLALVAVALECVAIESEEAAIAALWAVLNIAHTDVADQLRNG